MTQVATMATTERDPSTSSDERRPSSLLGYKYTEKPLFVNKHNRQPVSFTSRRNRIGGAVAEEQEAVGAPATNLGWLNSGGSNRMGLSEAFARTDENGDFIPRARPGLESREGTISESRIPRTRTFSPEAAKGASPSPPRSGTQAYTLRGREGRATSVPVVEYESEDTGAVRQGSPSPGPRDRRWSERKTSEGDDFNASPVEKATKNDLGRDMSKWERDEARLKRMANSTKPVLLGRRRADVGPKVAETTRTLEKKTSTSSFESGTLERKTSASSFDFDNEPEPPLRAHTTWGKRAKKNSSWMQKILSPDTSLELKDPLEDPVGERFPQTAPDTPLPSIEDRSAIPTPPASRPASAQPANASPEKSKIWDADLDFTAHSLQVSTSPQLRVKKSKLEEVRSREIQSLTARAVATSRLEEIRERNSEERFLGSESDQVKEVTSKEEPASEEQYHKSILEEEGEKIPHAPITVFRAKDYEDYVKRNNITFRGSTSSSSSSSRERNLNGNRPGSSSFGHERNDSRELLRRLSRAVSRSASSSPAPPTAGDQKQELANRTKIVKDSNKADTNKVDIPEEDRPKDIEPNRSKPVNESKVSGTERPDNIRLEKSKPGESNAAGLVNDLKTSDVPASSKSDVDPEERITAEARLFDLQDNRSERNSIRVPSPAPSDDGNFDETPRPRPKMDPMLLATPRVIGAYIETPAAISRVIREPRSISPSYEVVDVPEENKDSKNGAKASARSEKYRTQSKSRNTSSSPDREPPSRFRGSRPSLINTAKPVSATEDLRRIQLEAQLDDSTLDDFDAILEAEAAEGQTTILDPVLDLEYDENGLPLSKKEIERRVERLTLDRMNQSLKATSTSIRDARHGIERLEEQVSSSFIKIAQPADGTMYINLKVPVPKLWVTLPPAKAGMKFTWKFTWLGLVLSLFLAWYVSESAMCAQFCHPAASSKNTWQPSDPFFPWAIPTKLDQWTGEVVSSSLSSVASGLGIRNWDWSPIPTLARDYKGGPIGSSDWWLGRNGPIGLVSDERDKEDSFSDDEMI